MLERREDLSQDKREKSVVQLIADAQNGDQDAFSLLSDRYRPLIDACSHRFATSDMTKQDTEDLSQEALVRFCGAVCSYDTQNESVEFGLYAKICIENGLVSFIRSHNRRNRLKALSLDGTGGLRSEDSADILQSLVDRERTALLVRRINSRLSEYEKSIWWLYVSGVPVKDIAKRLSTDSKSVSNAVYRIRKKLKDTLLVSEK